MWDDPVTTYNITSSTAYQSADVQVNEASLSTAFVDSIVDDGYNSGDTGSDRAVAQFADANPYAAAGDFSVQSIDWGDGTTTYGGWVSKDSNGNFDVMGFHDYGGPNPATSMDGDGKWQVEATVMEPLAGGDSSSGQTVAAKGGITVIAPDWLNVYPSLNKPAPPTPPGQLPPPPVPYTPVDMSNNVITEPANPLNGITSFSFVVLEYSGKTNAQVPMGTMGLTINQNWGVSTAFLPQGGGVSSTPSGPKGPANAPTGYSYYTVNVKNATNCYTGCVMALDVGDVGNAVIGHMRVIFK